MTLPPKHCLLCTKTYKTIQRTVILLGVNDISYIIFTGCEVKSSFFLKHSKGASKKFSCQKERCRFRSKRQDKGACILVIRRVYDIFSIEHLDLYKNRTLNGYVFV